MLPLLALVVLAPGCVTESTSTTPRGVPVRRAQGAAAGPAAEATLRGAAAGSAPSSFGRTRFAIQPAGVIAYDGFTLPLVSPDGRFVAAQVGAIPGWPAILAVEGDTRFELCRVRVYAIDGGSASVSDRSSELPRGLLLGRSASESGFLVEAPQPDGARWIGRVDWRSGALTWLVQEAQTVAAHAIELRDGRLVYARRPVGSRRFELVLRPPSGASPDPAPAGAAPEGAGSVVVPFEAAADDSLMFPVTTPRQDHVGAFAVASSRPGLELLSFSVAGPRPLLVARARLGGRAAPEEALRACASIDATPWSLGLPGGPGAGQSPGPSTGQTAGQSAGPAWLDSFTVVSTRWSSAVLVHSQTGEVVKPEAPALSLALIDGPQAGFLISGAKDLLFAAAAPATRPGVSSASGAGGASGSFDPFVLGPPVRVLAQPLIARALRGSVGGPAGGGGGVGGGALAFGPDPLAPEPSLRLWSLQAVSGP